MLSIDLFAEDSAHELVVTAIVTRVLNESNLSFRIHTRNAAGGHGKAISELKLYQKAIQRGALGLVAPDLLVVAIDANCKGHVEARNEIDSAIDRKLAGDVAIACPDPHIERWFFADPGSFKKVVGFVPTLTTRKCEKNVYKTLLRNAVRQGGHVPTLGGLEFAEDVVNEMDFSRAEKREPSLGHLLDGLRAFKARQTS